MGDGPFKPHGEFEFSVEGRVLRVRTSGPWNKELIQQYAGVLAQALASLAGAPWGVFATVVGQGLHTPESFAEMQAGIGRQRAIGRCATAVVLENVEGAPIVQRMLERMYREAGEPAAFFDDSAAAMAWLRARIADSGR